MTMTEILMARVFYQGGIVGSSDFDAQFEVVQVLPDGVVEIRRVGDSAEGTIRIRKCGDGWWRDSSGKKFS